jgi:uncharacterized Zn finger protein
MKKMLIDAVTCVAVVLIMILIQKRRWERSANAMSQTPVYVVQLLAEVLPIGMM